ITNCRKHHLHQTSFNIVKNHDVIAIEDLHVKGMMRNKRLAKAIGDSAWNTFVEMLAYKAEWYGKQLVRVDRWFPSSKTCSSCGHILSKDELTLSVRQWTCPSCHTEHDRDTNASVNILKEGLRLFETQKEPLVQGG